MIRQMLRLLILCLALMNGTAMLAEEELSVLPDAIDGVKSTDMMKNYLLHLAGQKFEDWKQRYEHLETPEQITEYQKRLRSKFLEAVGGLPERTPLNPQVTGVVLRDGYRVEKVIFESQPKHYVTAALFLPDGQKHKAPYPGVLVPCGHSRNAKAYESYQTMGALLALNGMAALVFDPIDQGERSQMPAVFCSAAIPPGSRYGTACAASTTCSHVPR